MSQRIAHRPRYRDLRHLTKPSARTYKTFFKVRWTYRRQALPPPKSLPGQSLMFVPFQRFVHAFR